MFEDRVDGDELVDVGTCGFCEQTRELVADVEITATLRDGSTKSVSKSVCAECVQKTAVEFVESGRFSATIAYEDGSSEDIHRG